MGRLLKIVLGIAAAVVLLLVVAVVIVSLTFDPNDYKEELITQVESRTGRSFEIDGDIGLSLFPVLAVDVGRVRLGNAPDFPADADFLSLERASVSIRVLPALLRREIRMGSVVVDTLTVNLAVNSRGMTNWEDLAQANTETQEAEPAEDGGMTVSALEIAGLQIRNASLTYSDAASGSEYRLSELEMSSGAVAPGQPISLEGGFTFDLQPDAIAGKVAIELTADFDEQQVALSGLSIDGQVTGVADVPVELSFNADALTANLEQQTLSPGSISLSVMDIDIEADVEPFAYSGALTTEATLSVAPFSARSLMSTMGMEPLPTADPDVLENIRLDAAVKVSDNDIAMNDLTLVIDDTTFTGKLSVPRANTGRYRVILAGDTIDIARYMAPAPEEGEDAEATGSQQVEIPVELIRAFDITGKFTLDEARLGTMRFTGLELGVVSTDGNMRLNPINAQLFDGTYSGDIRINASGPETTLSVNENIAGVSLAPLADALYGQQNLTGTIDGSFRLAGTGKDMDAIRRDLDGTLSFSLSDGAYEGTDIWHQLRSARAKLRGEQPPEPELPPRTPFSGVSASGQVTDGIMRNDDFRADLPFLQLTGSGTVNFVEANVDYSMTARVLERPEFVTEATDEELAEFTEAVIPLKITGPLAAPKIRPDFEALFRQRVEEEAKKKILDKLLGGDESGEEEGQEEGEKDAEDILKDKLKDLFKK
ncbi:MAG: AsmA family protein [Woeseiaceae bacterium]|nr:AsmA family protein [Woeseiaceae bacterium]